MRHYFLSLFLFLSPIVYAQEIQLDPAVLSEGHADFVQLVAEKDGATVEQAFKDGKGEAFNTPSHLLFLKTVAARNPDASVMHVLNTLNQKLAELDTGTADFSFKNPMLYNLPFIVAAAHNTNPDVLKELITAGADINAVNSAGESALFAAALKNPKFEILTFLLENGADVNFKNKDEQTPLMALAESSDQENVFDLFFTHGADINWRANSGITALMVLAKNTQNPALIRKLIEQGADINASGDNGETALVYAIIGNNNLSVTEELLTSQANINVQNAGGITPLMWGVIHNENPDVVRLLLKYGADPTVKNKKGYTALDLASQNKDFMETPAYQALKGATLDQQF